MRRTLIYLLLAITSITASAQSKREFRGAWIQCVNGQFMGMGTEKMQRTLSYQLDELQKDGVNAIIFQVRPECDALYASSFEPLPDRPAGCCAISLLGPTLLDD